MKSSKRRCICVTVGIHSLASIPRGSQQLGLHSRDRAALARVGNTPTGIHEVQVILESERQVGGPVLPFRTSPILISVTYRVTV